MRAGKAYISSLGTTGLLIASSVMLLLVVGAFVAFDSWPTHAAVVPEEVEIADAPRPEVIRTQVDGSRAVTAQGVAISARGAAAARRASVSGVAEDRVLSALPAPSVGPRHLPDPPQPSGGARGGEPRANHPSSVELVPLPLGGDLIASLPASELPAGSATLDDIVKRADSAAPAGSR
jgi:hypothetical protein